MKGWLGCIWSLSAARVLLAVLVFAAMPASWGQAGWMSIESAPEAGQIVLSGHVLQLSGGNMTPVASVDLELCCSDNASIAGRAVFMGKTDSSGQYELAVNSSCPFYNIILARGDGCNAVSTGGIAVNASWIQYQSPLDGLNLNDNDFMICNDTCPDGCECLTEGEAMRKFDNDPIKCAADPCDLTLSGEPMYCYKCNCQPISMTDLGEFLGA